MLYKCKLYHATSHDPTEPVWSVPDAYLARYKQAALLCPACGQIMEPVQALPIEEAARRVLVEMARENGERIGEVGG